MKEELDSVALASRLVLARAEQVSIDGHLAVAELVWQQGQTRATLRAVQEVREQYRLNRALMVELEEHSE